MLEPMELVIWLAMLPAPVSPRPHLPPLYSIYYYVCGA
jgi:hypothetical protein